MIKTESAPGGRLFLAIVCLLMAGCSRARQPPNEKPVVPVTGSVTVDGAPLAGVRINFHSKTPAETHRMFPKAMTDDQGKFEAWTYRKGDGLAAGNYTVTFLDHSQAFPGARESEKTDDFNGKYANPDTSEFTITIPDDGEPVELPPFELTH